MRKTTLICFSALMVASVSATTFDIKGRALNEKQASNPDIVSINKETMARENIQKPLSTPNALTKSNLPNVPNVDQVRKTWGMFKSNTEYYALNGYKRSKSVYFRLIDNFESGDEPRRTYTGLGYQNTADPYPSKIGNGCTIVSRRDNLFYSDMDEFSKDLALENDCSNNACGQGISIYNVIADNPIPYDNNCKTNNITRNYTYGIQHYFANMAIKRISPDVTTSSVNEGDARIEGRFVKRPEDPYQNRVHIGNNFTTSTNDVRLYNNEAAELDDYIYHNRVIEFAPFTNNGKRTGAGISLNAISVGGANDNNHTPAPVAANPQLVNAPRADYNKPEIYVPSYYLSPFPNADKTALKHDGDDSDLMAISDGWGASTVAASMAADLLSKYPFYKWHPEVVKALIVSAGNKEVWSIQNPRTESSTKTLIRNKHILSFDEMTINNVSRYWYGNSNDFFNSNEELYFYENVDQGKKYRLAIAWLVNGKYANEYHHLSANYTFSIYNAQTGALLSSNMIPAANYLSTHRSIDLTIPQGISKIKVIIRRSFNRGDRVILGYNMHKFAN